MTDLATLFVRSSSGRLKLEYLPRIQSALEILDNEDLWWKPKEFANSVGNLLLHLEGNVRQWIIGGIAGKQVLRDRALEFSAGSAREAGLVGQKSDEPDDETVDLEETTVDASQLPTTHFLPEKAVLFRKLAETVEVATQIIERCEASELEAALTIQGFKTTGLDAIYHVVEHFAWHTGQIVYVTKERSARGKSLRFYDDDELNTRQD